MVRPEQAYDSFQIIRPVLETAELNRFLEAAEHLGKIIFVVGETVALSDGEQGEVIDSAQTREVQHLPVARHEVYSRTGLKLALLDRRSPKGGKYKTFERAYRRFSLPMEMAEKPKRGQTKVPVTAMPYPELERAALLLDIPDTNELRVTFNAITFVHDPSYKGSGVELALVPDSTRVEAQLLQQESQILFDAAEDYNPNLVHPSQKTTMQVSFGRTIDRLNFDDANRVDHYVERLSKHLPVSLELGSITPKLNT